jgi:hypothetical protein
MLVVTSKMFRDNRMRLAGTFDRAASSDVSVQKRNRGDVQPSAEFEFVLMQAVDLALVHTLGDSAAAAVKFYVDTSLICRAPLLFEQSLAKLFGSSQKGQQLLEEKIRSFLVDLLARQHSVHIPTEEWSHKQVAKSFAEFIVACRREFIHQMRS